MTLSTATLSVLEFLEGLRRERDASRDASGYNDVTEDDSVNVEYAAVRRGNHPPAPGRSASSRMIR
jgi:hypothetical protein